VLTPDDIALRVTQAAARRFSFEEVTAVMEALAALGYEFRPPGSPGRYIESDEVRHAMALYLAGKTGLHLQITRGILVAIEKFGLRICEPLRHPSGLKTTAHAFTTVVPFGARQAAAQKPIDDRMPGHGRNYA
jgi:hypothetical protein